MIYYNKINFLIWFFLTFGYTIDLSISRDEDKWHILQEKKINISWKNKSGTPFCKANIIYNYPSEKIKSILENKEEYPNIFERIESCDILSENIVYIKLDLPFPFAGRDYVVKYEYYEEDNYEYYIYKATNDVNVEMNKNYVRLTDAAGMWKIKSINKNKTELTYIWNGELLGNFPDWALEKAWIEQGNEVLNWIENALEKK